MSVRATISRWALFVIAAVLSATNAAAYDFNADGKADLIWRNQSTGATFIWMMNGVTPTTYTTLPTVPIDWQIVGVGDFNANGRPDLVWRRDSGENYVWFMNATSQTGIAALPALADPTWKLAGVGDFNADGRPDLV